MGDPLATDHARILDSLVEPVLVIDAALRIVYLNAAARERYGSPDLEAGAHYCFATTHGATKPCYAMGMICPVRAVFASGLPSRTIHHHKTAAGVFLPEEISSAPLRDATGTVAYVIETVRSAADLLETQEVIEHMRAELDLLRGILPTCAQCKRIRTADGEWEDMESYISRHSSAQFSHGICPQCVSKLYPGYEASNK